MSVLIAGGGGFIGSHLARRLAELGEKVVILDPSPTPSFFETGTTPLNW
jgi:nucleoside-diphosphate-sugar epimerase